MPSPSDFPTNGTFQPRQFARLAGPVPPRMIEREIVRLPVDCHRGSCGSLHAFDNTLTTTEV